MRRLALVVLVGACGFKKGLVAGDGGGGSADGPTDTIGPGSDGSGSAANCFGGGSYDVCLSTLPSGTLTLGGVTIDTGATCHTSSGIMGEIVDPGGGATKLCVFSGTTVTITGPVRATGSFPLVFIATTGALTVAAGGIDVSSTATSKGAGANDTHCSNPQKGNDGDGASGGAGGSFGTKGGNGGDGSAAGAGASATAATGKPAFIRGGCPGSAGGNGTNPIGMGGVAGNGGGAVYLIATGNLQISAPINASGGPGGGAIVVNPSSKDGGGGAGSGGMIALYGKTGFGVGASVFANGGGGGGGGDDVNGSFGGVSGGPAVAAGGGQGGTANGTNGGDGAIGTENGFVGVGPGGGGGGGGGAVGVVTIVSGQSIGGSQFSPPPS